MRVALDVSAVPARPVGAGVYVLRLAEALAARDDVALHLVARRADAERWRRVAPGAGVEPAAPGSRPARLAWEQLRAPAVARRVVPAVWHAPHYTLPLRSPVPTVVTVHDLTLVEHPEWHERSKARFFGAMIRLAARQADVLVCVSAHTARRLEAVVAPRVPVAVVPHGVDHARFRPEGGGDEVALARLGVRPPFVAFVGTVEPRKGVPVLVEAFRRLRPSRPDLQLVLAGRHGWGPAAPEGEGILRLDWVDDPVVPALLRSAAAVAYPSLEEGFGLPALEALACGAALVTTTGSAMQDVVDDAAVLVPPGDAAALADALAAVLDGTDVARLRRRGPEVAAPYTWAASAEGHVAAYRRAVEHRR